MLVALPHPPGGGGPGSFQTRIELALKEKGHTITYSLTDENVEIVFIVGGTRRILELMLAKRKTIPIVHRLDGISWLHRKKFSLTEFQYFLKSEFANCLINFEHSYLASKVVYQSEFVKQWWGKCGWRSPTNSHVINNGVCLERFRPDRTSSDPVRLICIEGTLDYSPFSVDLINELNRKLSGEIKFAIYGSFHSAKEQARLDPSVDFRGRLTPEQIVNAYQRAIYLSLDVNAACPNTVIEALASGAPVVGFDTGALKELVADYAGQIVPYGGDPWNLDYPDVNSLIKAIRECHRNWDTYSIGARGLAEERFGLERMVGSYLSIFESMVAR